MPGVLNLVARPGATLKPGEGYGAYRDDPHDVVLQFRDEDGAAIDMTGSYTAQVRRSRLPDPADPDPLAEYDVDTSDAVNGNITLHLDRTVTETLALKQSDTAVWDFQNEDTGVTALTGNWKIWDDVSRPA